MDGMDGLDGRTRALARSRLQGVLMGTAQKSFEKELVWGARRPWIGLIDCLVDGSS